MRAAVLLVCLAGMAMAYSIPDTPYLQLTSTRYTYAGVQRADWAELPMSNTVLHMAADSQAEGGAWAITDSQLWYYTVGGQATAIPAVTVTNHSRVAECGGVVAVVTRDGIYRCTRTTLAKARPTKRASFTDGAPAVSASCTYLAFDGGDMKAAMLTPSGDLYFGGERGLFMLANDSNTVQPNENVTEEVFSMTWQASSNMLWIGTHHRVYWLDTDTNELGYVWTLSVFGRTPRAMSFDEDDTLWVGSYEEISCMYPNGTVFQTNGQQGLPYNHILTMAPYHDPMYGGTRMWMGTKKGTVIHDADGTWHFYMGPRWTPGDCVHSIVVTMDGTILLATDGGMAEMVYTAMTLAQKAADFQAIIQARHIRSGITTGVQLNTWGDVNSWEYQTDANSGLWTGMYAASQAFRYGATLDPDARDDAWVAYEGMEKLFTVTGVPGYPARCFWSSTPDFGNGWCPSPTNSSLQYNTNTSSDEITGHMFAYPLILNLVAESEANRSRVRDLMDSLMNNIVSNDLRLKMAHDQTTQWGRWYPEIVNSDVRWRDQTGANSLEILAYLQAIYQATMNETYLNVYNSLVEDHHYAENVINSRLQFPEKINYSDDELEFLAFFTYLYTNGTAPEVQIGLHRTFSILESERSPLWNFIYAAFNPSVSAATLDAAVYSLHEWPMEWVDWPVNNTYRLDKTINVVSPRISPGELDSIQMIPYDEQCFNRWNGDPFSLSPEGSGYEEVDPTAWLLPYWMGRYYGFIEAPMA